MTNNIRILIVEDDTKILRDSEDIFNNLATEYNDQLNIFTATNAIDARKIIKNTQLDAIILDYELVGSNGGQVIDKLPNYLNYPLIALVSAFGEQNFSSIEKKSTQMGCEYAYYHKPVKPGEMKTIYNRILRFVKEKPLPYPLGYTLKAYQKALGSEKLYKMRDFIEMSVKYLAGILLADLAGEALSRQGKVTQPSLGKCNFNKISTFGDWLRLLDFLSQKNSTFVPELQNIFAQPLILSNPEETKFLDFTKGIEKIIIKDEQSEELIEITQISNLQSFLDLFKILRNDIIGHPVITLDPPVREKLAEAIEPIFCEFKDRMLTLANYPLFIVDDYTWGKTDQDTNIYTVTSLMGTDELGTRKEFCSDLRLHKNNNQGNHIYLGNGLGDFLPLAPFISYQPAGNTNKIFVIDSFQPQKIKYKSFDNATSESAENYQALKDLFKKIN